MTETQVHGWARDHVEPIGVSDVVYATEHAFGLPRGAIAVSSKAHPTTVLARKIAIYLSRELTPATWQEIGAVVLRDHSTCVQHHKQIRRALMRDDAGQLRTIVGGLREELVGNG